MTNTMNFPPSSDTTDRLNTPGDLMAAVPGILGFYPHESIIIVGMHAGTTGGNLTLGPVMRADLNHWQDLPNALNTPSAADCEVFFAFLVTRSPESPTVGDLIDALYQIHDENGDCLIHACWVLSEIATGSHYDLCFGEVPPYWVSGAVPCIALSAAMQPLIENGGLPALTRDDTVDYFAKIALDDDTRDTFDGACQLAYCRGQDLHDRLERQLPGPAEAVQDADRALAYANETPLVNPYDDKDLTTVWAESEGDPVSNDVVAVMTCLSRSRLRDSIVVTALAQPQRAGTLLLFIARVSSGVIRANALSVWAIVAMSAGLYSWASAALKNAQVELEGHGLSAALLKGLAIGGYDRLLLAVKTGSEEQRDMLNLPPAPTTGG
ncbi:DUF4192 domain-containing protein [Corynebacterium cystitidis]|uniref:DUF4192 domain-containing protein n=1 Tax=Corynebacterium cystitidis TaxID=35757 RepID=UPI00211E04DE|nr:DUF4192 domain-containing protein [Corynebacterium cystitidis]